MGMMEAIEAVAEALGYRKSDIELEMDRYEKSELERKIGEGSIGATSEKSVSLARMIGNLAGLRRWLFVKSFNCDYGLSPDEILAVDRIVQNAMECRTVAKEKYAHDK